MLPSSKVAPVMVKLSAGLARPAPLSGIGWLVPSAPVVLTDEYGTPVVVLNPVGCCPFQSR